MTALYLAGPMRGIKDFNFPAFDVAAAKLRAAGYEVFSPADHDRSVHGDTLKSETGIDSDVPHFSLRNALKADTSWICDYADGIAILPGADGSLGALAEMALADALLIPVRRVEDWIGGRDYDF